MLIDPQSHEFHPKFPNFSATTQVEKLVQPKYPLWHIKSFVNEKSIHGAKIVCKNAFTGNSFTYFLSLQSTDERLVRSKYATSYIEQFVNETVNQYSLNFKHISTQFPSFPHTSKKLAPPR